jgi:hypothetical protein
MSNLFPIILFQTVSTVFASFLYHYLSHTLQEETRAQKEKIQLLTNKIINMEEHMSFLRYSINDLEEKVDNTSNGRMVKSCSDLDRSN